MNIFIFSRPVHSGKTTALLHWCKQQQNIAGVLMPDIDGSRKILNLNTKEIFDIECKDPLTTTEPLTTVGRFHFYTAAFEKANAILEQTINENHNWLVIDEAGKLELEGKGLHESVVKAVAWYSKGDVSGNLLLVVRESLCAEVIAFFKIQNCRIIHQLQHIG